MDFKQLYARLSQIAAQRNEKYPFVEGDPKIFGGHGRPDPDWALLSIYAGEQEGVLSAQQGEELRKQFAPYARFEHQGGEVRVRAHIREGKAVAAHTRSVPHTTGASETLETQISKPISDLRRSAAETASQNAPTPPPSEESVEVAQNTNVGGSMGRTLLKFGLESYQAKKQADELEGADLKEMPQEAADILEGYDAVERKVVVDAIKDGADYNYMKRRNPYITLDEARYRKLEGIFKPLMPRR